MQAFTYTRFDVSRDFGVPNLHAYAIVDKEDGLRIFCTNDDVIAFNHVVSYSHGYPLSEYCFWCGNNDPSVLKLFCARCKVAKYCSEECKLAHYYAEHKKCNVKVGWDENAAALILRL